MKETLNENLLKFTGTLCLPESLDLDEDLTFGVTANIQKREQRSLNDGSYNLVHSAKLIGEAVVQTKYGKNIALKSKGSLSARFRSRMLVDYEGDDFEKDREEYMNLMIINWPKVKEFIDNFLKE